MNTSLLRALRRFVEDSDQSIPRIAELMGVSGTTLSMWIAGTAKPTTSKLLEITVGNRVAPARILVGPSLQSAGHCSKGEYP
jgi:DNA transposition AAA+ family ATPase